MSAPIPMPMELVPGLAIVGLFMLLILCVGAAVIGRYAMFGGGRDAQPHAGSRVHPVAPPEDRPLAA
jgi:hypothetical protein